jgi:Ni,Fe-hydrogenase maturation factor
LKGRKGVRMLTCFQLEPGLVETLRAASSIIFIDACLRTSNRGWNLARVEPDLGDVSYLTHHCTPAFLLGLLQSMYAKKPIAWVVSILGDDFELGVGLSRTAEQRAKSVVSELARWIEMGISSEIQILKDQCCSETRGL